MFQTCLEKRGIKARHRLLAKSEYNRDNQYGPSHKNALADGDLKGKGTGYGGHTFWLPDCNAEPNVFRFDNFDTDPSSHPGNGDEQTPGTDRYARQMNLVRSLYSKDNPYNANNIDTSKNVADGQYVVHNI